jgi:hypothetical protein
MERGVHTYTHHIDGATSRHARDILPNSIKCCERRTAEPGSQLGHGQPDPRTRGPRNRRRITPENTAWHAHTTLRAKEAVLVEPNGGIVTLVATAVLCHQRGFPLGQLQEISCHSGIISRDLQYKVRRTVTYLLFDLIE